MIVIPAIDLRGGRGVLRTGSATASTNRDEVIRLATDLGRQGFTRLHVIDLDATSGSGSNVGLVQELVRTSTAGFQIGGGLHDADGVRDVLELGADFAVVSARSLHHLDHLSELAEAFPNEVILSVPFRDRRAVVDDWARSLPLDVLDLAQELAGLPLAAVLLRAVDREGTLAGPDFRLVEDAVEVSLAPILVAGGVASMGHLRNLDDRGAAGAIIGAALHAGLLPASAVIGEFPG